MYVLINLDLNVLLLNVYNICLMKNVNLYFIIIKVLIINIGNSFMFYVRFLLLWKLLWLLWLKKM